MKSISATVKLIKSGKLKSEDLVLEHLKLAKTRGKDLNAFITILDDAVDKAKAIDTRVKKGEFVGRLAGIPCTVKDVFMMENVRTTAGSKILEDFIAPYSATVVEKIESEGAIVIGKTNCDPFAFGASGENSGYGPTLNPYDKSRVPGGSSSGAAASLASGIGYFALGTDTGGSVRQPAGFCGLVGFKPTYGRNSRYGLIAMGSSFDTPGVLARTVEDGALVESILAGKDPQDATTYEVPVVDYQKKMSEGALSKMKFGVPEQYFKQGIDPEVKKTIEMTLEKIEKAGGKVVSVSIPLLEDGIAAYYILVPSEISSNMARYDGVRYGKKVDQDYRENLFKTRGKFLEEEVKRRIMIGTYCLSAGYADQYYKNAQLARVKLIEDVNQAYEKVDFLVGPTSPTTAFKIGEKSTDPLAMYLADVYTVIANLTGCPAISINCGFDKKGLPIGLQLMSTRFTEEMLFAGAFNIEKILNLKNV